MSSVYKIFVEKPIGTIPIKGSRSRWEDIRTDLRETVGSCGLDSSRSGERPVAVG
jgi:hypothetical protein